MNNRGEHPFRRSLRLRREAPHTVPEEEIAMEATITPTHTRQILRTATAVTLGAAIGALFTIGINAVLTGDDSSEARAARGPAIASYNLPATADAAEHWLTTNDSSVDAHATPLSADAAEHWLTTNRRRRRRSRHSTVGRRRRALADHQPQQRRRSRHSTVGRRRRALADHQPQQRRRSRHSTVGRRRRALADLALTGRSGKNNLVAVGVTHCHLTSDEPRADNPREQRHHVDRRRQGPATPESHRDVLLGASDTPREVSAIAVR